MRLVTALLTFTSLCGAAPIVTCNLLDQSGSVVSNTCTPGIFGYQTDISAGATPAGWGVYARAGGYVAANPPYTASISFSGHASFSLPIVVLGETGSAYLWYRATEFRSEHFGNASFNVISGYAGYVSANGSAPCSLGARPGEQLSSDCYIPFTYGVPLTLSGSAGIDGYLTGGYANDYAEYHAAAMLMGIVSEQGSHNLTAQDAVIVEMPEPAMLPALLLLAPIGFLARRRMLRNQ